MNKGALIKRGWTRTSIKRLLGEPDWTIQNNHNPERPECRYLTQRVIDCEDAGRVRFRRSKFDVPLYQKRGHLELHEYREEDIWAILNPPDIPSAG
jgi:hypothetical protein